MWRKDFLLHDSYVTLENSADSCLCFCLALLHSVSYFFLLYWSPSSLCKVFDSISSNIDEVLWINPSADVFVFGDFNVHHKDWITYSGGTDRSGEFCYNFSISNDLTQMVNFPTWIPDCYFHSPLLDLYFFLTLIFVLQGLSLYWKILVMLLSQSPFTFHHIHNRMPRFIDCIAYDYSPADWGGVCYHLRDVLRGDIFKLSAAATVRMDWTLITLFLLMWKWMGLFLRKNHLLRCWGWPSLLNWIGALTLSLLPKLLPRKLELNSFYEVSFS